MNKAAQPTMTRRGALGVMAGAFAAAAVDLGRDPEPDLAPVPRDGTDLVRDGSASSVLVVPPDATANELLAAIEVQSHVASMTGATLEIVDVSPTGGSLTPVYFGRACPDPGDVPANDEQSGDSFRLSVTSDAVQLNGLGDTGTLIAAYELLEQLGVRFLMAGPHGTVVPSKATARLRRQDRAHVPTFHSRLLQFVGKYLGAMPAGVDRYESADWVRRRRMRGDAWGSHGIDLEPPATPQTNPEFFIMENGKRTKQLDVTHPEVLRRAITACRTLLAAEPDPRYISMGPSDGHGFGSTEWDADDYDPMAGFQSVTDRYIKFFNLVLDDLQHDYPDVGIAFFCYDNYMRPPVREIPNRKILPVVAPINVDRLHTVADPSGWERRHFMRLVDRWRELVDEWTFRGYLFNLADPGLPFSGIRPAIDEFTYFYEHGASEGNRVECSASWGWDGPAFYLATALMWDIDANPVRVLREFYSAAYGPAAATMARFFAKISTVQAEAPYNAGRWFDHTKIFSAETMAELNTELTKAEKIAADAGDPGIIDRVRTTRLAFTLADSFLTSLRHFERSEFEPAHAAYQSAITAFDATMAHKPVALYPLRGRFLDLFSGPVTQAYERSTGDNEIAVHLPDIWNVLLDSDDTAEGDEVFAVDVPTDTWRTLQTKGATWSAQGLRYFRGSVWYRTTISVDAAYAGRQLSLWISQDDEDLRLWINGVEIPSSAEGASFQPTEFDISGRLRFDGHDIVVIKGTNVRLNELGTGGIAGPGFVWAGGAAASGQTSAAPRYRRGDGARSLDVGLPAPPDVGTRSVLIKLPDEWHAMVDPEGDCDNIGLWEPIIPTTSGWMTVRTCSQSWPQQGLGYYTGGLAYRTSLRVHRRHVSDSARIVFTRIDGQNPRVWLAGTELQVAVDGSADGWWEFDAGTELRRGTHVLVVSVAPAVSGTGGITGPAYLLDR